MSSAYINVEHDLIAFGKSLTKMTDRWGPKMDPCVTLEFSDSDSEYVL